MEVMLQDWRRVGTTLAIVLAVALGALPPWETCWHADGGSCSGSREDCCGGDPASDPGGACPDCVDLVSAMATLVPSEKGCPASVRLELAAPLPVCAVCARFALLPDCQRTPLRSPDPPPAHRPLRC